MICAPQHSSPRRMLGRRRLDAGPDCHSFFFSLSQDYLSGMLLIIQRSLLCAVEGPTTVLNELLKAFQARDVAYQQAVIANKAAEAKAAEAAKAAAAIAAESAKAAAAAAAAAPVRFGAKAAAPAPAPAPAPASTPAAAGTGTGAESSAVPAVPLPSPLVTAVRIVNLQEEVMHEYRSVYNCGVSFVFVWKHLPW